MRYDDFIHTSLNKNDGRKRAIMSLLNLNIHSPLVSEQAWEARWSAAKEIGNKISQVMVMHLHD